MKSNDMKGLSIGIGILLVLGLAGVVLNHPMPPLTPGEQLVAYTGQANIHFLYPGNYTITERADSYEGNPIRVLTLTDRSISVPDMSEGPEAISIIEVPNPENIPLAQWVKEKSISNFQLSPDQVLASTTVAGAPAVSYTHSGLYESQATAAAPGNKIFILSVGSTDPHAPIARDFQNLLKTVQFK